MRSTRLSDIPTDEFAFNHDRYHRLTGEFEEIARAFAELGHAGNPHGRALAKRAAEVNQAIWVLWDAVANAERSERNGAS